MSPPQDYGSLRHQPCQKYKRAASGRLISYWFSYTFIKIFGNNSHFLRLERISKRLEAALLEYKRARFGALDLIQIKLHVRK